MSSSPRPEAANTGDGLRPKSIILGLAAGILFLSLGDPIVKGLEGLASSGAARIGIRLVEAGVFAGAVGVGAEIASRINLR